GFALIRGIPVDIWPREVTARVFWAIGSRIGLPVVQNPLGHVLGHVKDIGVDAEDPNQRGYQSAANLPFHTDVGAEVVGLHCLKPARSGGRSSVVSAATIWNEVLRLRPDLAQILTEPFYRDRRGEEVAGQKPWYPMPIFMPAGDRMAVAYVRRFIESCQRHLGVPRLTEMQIEAMDLVDSLAYDPDLRLDMDFKPGDIQLVNNLVTLHTRTEYEDWPDVADRRHLFRLWLTIPDGWPLPDPFYRRYGADVATGRPQGINLPPGVTPHAPLDVAVTAS
ncbi:MAG: TauD/TfdA family dioxygenase, partial [Alphaproteobacteria bacterium]